MPGRTTRLARGLGAPKLRRRLAQMPGNPELAPAQAPPGLLTTAVLQAAAAVPARLAGSHTVVRRACR